MKRLDTLHRNVLLCVGARPRMEKSDRPTLDPHSEAGLETAQIGVDKLFWLHLRSFQVLTAWGEHKKKQEKRPLGDAPPPAKRPAALRMTLVNYAHSLYNAEGNLYLEGPQIRYWLEKLRDRIINRVMVMVEKVEEAGEGINVSLKHHEVTPDDMRSTMRASLDDWIGKRLNPPPPREAPAPPPEIQAQMDGKVMLAALSDSQNPSLTGKQASDYAKAGIALASASPLLMMAHEAALQPASIIPTQRVPKRRIPRSIQSVSAAKRLEEYLDKKGRTQTQFSIDIGADVKTLYRFRQTGKVGKAVAQRIADAMGITLDDLLA
jgi:hypothetical protein